MHVCIHLSLSIYIYVNDHNNTSNDNNTNNDKDNNPTTNDINNIVYTLCPVLSYCTYDVFMILYTTIYCYITVYHVLLYVYTFLLFSF